MTTTWSISPRAARRLNVPMWEDESLNYRAELPFYACWHRVEVEKVRDQWDIDEVASEVKGMRNAAEGG